MKTYTISKKIETKNRKKNIKKTINGFFSLKTKFFCSENGGNGVSFPWPRRTSQSEFSIKSNSRLKLRWSDFNFYFFYLFSFFFLSSLSSLFLYLKTDEKGLVICEISVFKFLFLEL
jgi:hypothetical protein